MKRIVPILLGTAALLFWTGCEHRPAIYGPLTPARTGVTMITVTNRVDASLLRAPTNLFTLGPGDRLEIELLDEALSKTTTVVGPDGRIYFNLLPGLDVWGLTLAQVKERIESELAKFIRVPPRVNITLRGVESQRIWLLGRFQAPGVYPITGPTTLLEGISMAGGPMSFAGARDITAGTLSEDLADLRHSFVVRNGKLLPVDLDRLLNQGDLSQNIYLQPDDFVYFSPALAKEVYVLGAVLQPKPVPYTEGLTLAGAIAGAFGTVRDAYLNHVTVVRGSLSQPRAACVDYKAIVRGEAPDMALEPHDIVYVPFAPYRYLRRYIDIALDTFVSSVAINAGTSVISEQGTTSGGVFIPVGSGVQVVPPPAPPIR